MRREKVRSLEFEAALAIERQNKRRAIDSPEEAPVGKARSTGPSQRMDHNSTPGHNNLNSAATAQRVCPLTGNVVSASGLPISRRFNPPLLLSVRSKDRQPSQEIIDAMMAPPPIPSIQPVQSAIQPFQPVIQPYQPVIQQASQQPVVHHASRFNRPTTYSRTVINVQGYHRLVSRYALSIIIYLPVYFSY